MNFGGVVGSSGYALGAQTNAADNAAYGGAINANTPTNLDATPTNQNTGGGGAHNNLPPYVVVGFLIKY